MKRLRFSFLVFLLVVGLSVEVYGESRYGPIAGGVTSYEGIDGVTLYKAKLFAKIDALDEPDPPADITVDFVYSTDPDLLSSLSISGSKIANSDSDYTAIVEITGLRADTPYYYTPRFDGTNDFANGPYPYFKTGPTPNEDTEFTFGYLTDFAVVKEEVSTESFSSLGGEKNLDFVYVGGDIDHWNPYCPDPDPKICDPQRNGESSDYWAMHKENIDRGTEENPTVRTDYVDEILRKAWIFHSWGDHDYCRGNEDKYCDSKTNALAAFKDYYPSHTLANEDNSIWGIWRNFTYGNAEFFVLDVYYKKDPNNDDDNADKSMLGPAQEKWFKTSLQASEARWKFVFTDLSWHPTAKDKTEEKYAESWALFRTERDELVDFIRKEKIKNVIFLSGDWHAGALDNGINTDFWTMVVTSADNAGPISEKRKEEGRLDGCDTASWTDGGFGEWSHGTFGEEGSATQADCKGYGLIEVKTKPHRVILSVKNQSGDTVITGTVPDEVVIDNTDAGFSVEGDNWRIRTNTKVLDYYGENYHVAGTETGGTGANTANWSAELIDGPGSYEVFVWYPVYYGLATNAPYTINHNDESHTVLINQSINGASWISLGAYEFNDDDTENVTLSDNANAWVIADAVRFIPPDGIVDNADAGFKVGEGDVWKRYNVPYNTISDYGKDFRYHASGTGANTATWSAELTNGPGNYEVFVWYSNDSDLAFGLATDAEYTIDHAGGSDTVLVDQTVNGGRWVSIGIYGFADDGTENVTLSDNADSYVAADAVKWFTIGTTPIDTCTTISVPGVYELTQDLSSSSTCINITSSDVIFDGQGYTINGIGTYNTRGVYVYNSTTALTNVMVRNVTVTDWYSGIYYRNAENGSITNNTASNNDNGISLWSSSSNNTLINNTASYNSNNGIYLYRSSSNTLINNTANSNNNGIYLYYSSSNNITDNNAKENNYFDVFVLASSDADCNNAIEDNTGSGDRSIKYFNRSVSLQDEVLSELILCNSDNSNIDSVTIEGSATKKNNGLLVLRTDYSNFTNVNSSNNNYGIDIKSSSNNNITGNTANSNYWYGISLRDSSYNNIKDNNVSDNYYGISLNYYSSNNILTNNTASDSYYGIRLYYSSSNNILTNNTASNNNWYGIYLYRSSSNDIYNNLFNNSANIYFRGTSNNDWNTTKTPGTNIVGGPYFGGNFWATPDGDGFSEGCDDADGDGICDSSNPLVSGNEDYLPLSLDFTGGTTPINSCTTISVPGVYELTQDLSSSSTCINITSSDVIFDGQGYSITGPGSNNYGVYIYNSTTTLTNVAVRNVTVTGWSRGIYYRSAANGRIVNNTANSNTNGIYLYSSSSNNITNNTALNNNYGIYLNYYSSNNILTNNTASNNNDGIYLYYSSGNDITDNTASNNNYGIYLNYYSSNNILTNNTANSNDEYGIYLYASSGNDITDNTASNNGYGIYLYRSSSNDIYNNLFNNTNNFNFAGTIYANRWNTTKTPGTNIVGGPYFGGNFWATPDGDGFSEGCDDADGDGICDSSNPLVSGNEDYLPLSLDFTGGTTPINSCTTISVPGVYELTQDLSSSSTCINITSSDVIFDGQGYTIGGADTWGTYGVYVYNSTTTLTNVMVRNVTVTGWYSGIYYENAENGSITNNTASYNRNGIYLGYSSSNNTLINNTANSNNNGIYLYYSSSNNITNNNASNNGYGIWLYSSSNNTIKDNTAKENNYNDIYFIYSFWATSDADCNNVIEDNTGSGDRPIKYFNRSVSLQDEVLSELILCNADNSNIDNVTIEGSATKKNNGFFVFRTDYSNFTNINSSNNRDGIYLYSSSSNNITNNTANSNSNTGIYLNSASYNNITDNTASNNRYGIRLRSSSSSNNNLTNNTASSNSNYGIFLHYSSSNDITDNTASNNGYGIYLYKSSSNNITNNTANSNNYNGIYLYSSSSNLIHNNYFNNSANVDFRGTSNNDWNTTKTPGTNIVGGPYLGGNFWATPDGSGHSEGCDDADGDGICDSSYNLASGNEDYLPLSLDFTTDTTINIITPPTGTITDITPDLNLTVSEQSNITYTWDNEGNITGCQNCASYNTTYGEYANSSEQNLSAVWHFNENDSTTVHDDSGNGNDGTFKGAGEPAWNCTDAKYGCALQFDGSDDYIEMADDESLKPAQTITTSAWINLAENDRRHVIFSIKAHEANQNGIILRRHENNKIQFRVGNGTDISSIYSDNTIETNKWVHVVGRYDGSEVALWIDGTKQIDTETINAPIIYDATRTIRIGAFEVWGRFNGSLDEVIIWNKTLTASEIQNLYSKRLNDGQHNVTVYAKDTTGDTNSLTRDFTVAQVAPVLTVTQTYFPASKCIQINQRKCQMKKQQHNATFNLTYTVGSNDLSGGLKVAFGYAEINKTTGFYAYYSRFFGDDLYPPGTNIKEDRVQMRWAEPVLQTESPNALNYVNVSTTNDDVSASIIDTSKDGLNLTVSDTLTEGDKVIIEFHNISQPGIAVETDLMVLEDTNDDKIYQHVVEQYSDVTEYPKLIVTGWNLTRFDVIAPSRTDGGEFNFTVRAVDKKKKKYEKFSPGYIIRNYTGTISFNSSEWDASPPPFPPDYTYTFTLADRGTHTFNVTLRTQGIQNITVNSSTGITGTSNPISVKDDDYENYKIYWWGRHVHTMMSGHSAQTPTYAYDYAINDSALDVFSLSGHCGFKLFNWTYLRELPAQYYSPGKFVPMQGYEYAPYDTTWTEEGHRNILFKHSSGTDVYCSEKKGSDPAVTGGKNLTQIADKYAADDVFITYHHLPIKFQRNFSWQDESDENEMKLHKFIEIYSLHGSSEYGDTGSQPFLLSNSSEAYLPEDLEATAREGIAKGFILGIIAGTDNHFGKAGSPGTAISSGSGDSTRSKYARNGLTAIYAKDLTYDKIWEALNNRSTYGTTGARAIMEFSAVDGNNDVYRMGSNVSTNSDTIALNVTIVAPGTIDTIEIMRNGTDQVNTRYFGSSSDERFSWPDPYFESLGAGDTTSYYVWFNQTDGVTYGWSSPIWITKE